MSVTTQKKSVKPLSRSNPVLVKHCMSHSLHSIGKDQPLAVAHRLMKEHSLRHLPVLEGGKLVGLLSERDLYYLETVAGVDASKEIVEQGMSQDVYCTSPEARLLDVVNEMANQKYGCAVVVQGGKAIGIFTTIDALELLATYLRTG
jgi:acetoin utilization protein AcuB